MIIEPKNDKVFRFNDCRTHSSNDIFNGFPRLKKIKKTLDFGVYSS